MQDSAFRAKGILTNCRLLSYGECTRLLGDLKIGVILGVLKVSDVTAIDDLLVTARPACIKTQILAENSGVNGADLSETGENLYRAQFVKTALNKILI